MPVKQMTLCGIILIFNSYREWLKDSIGFT